jgi:dTDP-4-amino-4,6-dideoxygalactose transaminase
MTGGSTRRSERVHTPPCEGLFGWHAAIAMIPLNRTPMSAAQVARAVRNVSQLGRTEVFRQFEIALGQWFAWNGPIAFGRSARDLLRQCLASYCPPGSNARVIVPAYCCRAVGEAVRAAGAAAVPCDIDPRNGGIDPKALERLMDAGTRALILIPLFGVLGGIEACAKAATERGIPVIIDSAPVFSPRLVRLLENQASVFIFSFAGGKQLPVFGGGVALIREGAVGEHVRRSFLDTPSSGGGDVVTLVKALAYTASWRSTIPLALAKSAAKWARREESGSSSFSSLAATLALQLLPNLALELDQRLANERAYRDEFARTELPAPRGGEALTLACDQAPTLPLLRFPILLQHSHRRDRMLDRLWRGGVWASETGYPVSPGEGHYPKASFYAQRLLTLPIHGSITTADIRHIVALITTETCL